MSNSDYLCGSRDFHVDNLTVVNAGSSTTANAFTYLHDNIAIGAVHNSEERYDAPKCHPETRTAIQEEVLSWITHGDADAQPMKILWLTGPAGTGKTAIVGSVTDTCDDLGILAGSFFFASFTGSEDRRSKRRLVATLVYHLIIPLDGQHPLRVAILSAVQRDPSIFRRRLKDQFKILLVKPLRDTRGQFNPADLPRAFFIDGLDEVEAADSREPGRDQHKVRLENEKDQEDILSALLYAADTPSFPFLFVVASRPERAIRTFFASDADHLTRTIFIDEKYDPDSDIKLFLTSKFAEVRRRYALPASWPPPRAINDLVQAASGQFIYVATIIRFIQDSKSPNPQALLLAVLEWRPQDNPAHPLAALDALYTRIIMSSSDPLLVAKWFGAIRKLGSGYTALFVNQLLQQYEGEARCVLENQASLLFMPAANDKILPYKFYHKSLNDYFGEASRCGDALMSAHGEAHDFVLTRYGIAFKNKGPPRIVSDTESQYFMRFLLGGPSAWQLHPLGRSGQNVDLGVVDCDVSWWVHTLISLLPIGACEDLIYMWFRIVHGPSCSRGSPGNCAPMCEHWRSNLIRICKKLGWKVPDEIGLLREAVIRSAGAHYESKGPPSRPLLSLFFRAPKGLSTFKTPCDISTTSTRYTVDDDYQATLNLICTAFARLPENWMDEYHKGMKEGGKYPFDAMAPIIEPIAIDLGIQVEPTG